jgi:hypothetical protein
MRNHRGLLAAALSTVAMGIAANAAHAAIPAYATNTNAFVYTDGDPHLVPLKNGGETNIKFNAAGPSQRTLISYSAECSVVGPTSSWVDIDILVDGVAIAPSNDDNAFCAGIGDGINYHWASNIVSVVATGLSQGQHTLTVRARLQGFASGQSVRLDDTLLVLQR